MTGSQGQIRSENDEKFHNSEGKDGLKDYYAKYGKDPFDREVEQPRPRFATFFLPENPDELCGRLRVRIQEKQGGNDINRFADEIVALIDKLLEKKCVTSTQHKKLLKQF